MLTYVNINYVKFYTTVFSWSKALASHSFLYLLVLFYYTKRQMIHFGIFIRAMLFILVLT